MRAVRATLLTLVLVCLAWSTIQTQDLHEWRSVKHRRDRIRWREDIAVNQFTVEREMQQNGRLPMVRW